MKVQGAAARLDQTTTVLGCEREGDTENVVCRIPDVAGPAGETSRCTRC